MASNRKPKNSTNSCEERVNDRAVPRNRRRGRDRNRNPEFAGRRESMSSRISDRIQDAAAGESLPVQQGKTITRFDKDKFAVGSNSPEYYKRIPGVLDSLTTVYDNYIAGMGFRRFLDVAGGTYGDGVTSVPGIMVIKVALTPGISDGTRDAIGQSMQAIYAMIRHYNSGSTNYDAEDLFMYILSMANAYAYHAELVRVYGSLNIYNALNRYTAKAVVQAFGFDYEDLIKNQAEFLAEINMYASQLAQFCVPNVWSVSDKWYNLFQNIYLDNETNRAQYYAFVPAGRYFLDTSTSSLKFEAENASTPRADLAAIRATMRKFLDPIRSSEDFSTMSGDILKAYGVGNLISAPILPVTGYKAVPVYNTEMLTMIENMSALNVLPTGYTRPNWDTVDNMDITTSAGAVHFQPKWTAHISNPGSSVIRSHFLNFRQDKPSNDQILMATRLRPYVELTNMDFSADTAIAQVVSADTVIPFYFEMYYLIGPNGGIPDTLTSELFRTSYNLSSSTPPVITLARLVQFNWAPFVVFFTANPQGRILSPNIFGEVDNLIPWSSTNQKNLDSICIRSEFWTPGISNL